MSLGLTLAQFGGHVSKPSIRTSLNASAVDRIDHLVNAGSFKSRREFVELALEEKLDRFKRDRFAAECAKLDPAEEKALAEEGMKEWNELSRRQLYAAYEAAAADPVFMEEMGEMDSPPSG